MTNADRIRSMTDEEMAEWLMELVDCGEKCPVFDCLGFSECKRALLNWLKQEVTDAD